MPRAVVAAAGTPLRPTARRLAPEYRLLLRGGAPIELERPAELKLPRDAGALWPTKPPPRPTEPPRWAHAGSANPATTSDTATSRLIMIVILRRSHNPQTISANRSTLATFVRRSLFVRTCLRTTRMVLPDGPTARGAGVYTPFKSFAWFSRWSARNLDCDSREHHAKPNTSHEVTAARVGCPSGRTVLNRF